MSKTIQAIAAIAFAFAPHSLAAEGTVEGPKVHWDLAFWGKPRAISTFMDNLSEYTSARTDGQFTVEVHYGTLSAPREMLDNLRNGSFQIGTYCAGYYPGKLPGHTAIELPFLDYESPEHVRAVNDTYYGSPMLREEMARWNAMYYMSAVLPPYELVGKGDAPVALNDLDGLRVRAGGGMGESLAKYGAVPTSLASSEIYTSLDRGLLDAAALPYSSHEAFRTYEVGSWFSSGLSLNGPACGIMINKTDFEALPEQYRAVLMDYPDSDLGYSAHIDAVYAGEITGPGSFKTAGLTEWQVTDEMREQLVETGGKPVWDAWVQDMNDRGLDGEALLKTLLEAVETTRPSAQSN